MTPRLLGRDAAAAYCGISPNTFDAYVTPHVAPLQIGDRRLWDIRALDRWLDAQSGLAHSVPAAEKRRALEALNGDSDEGR
jgi:hypothetical protein